MVWTNIPAPTRHAAVKKQEIPSLSAGQPWEPTTDHPPRSPATKQRHRRKRPSGTSGGIKKRRKRNGKKSGKNHGSHAGSKRKTSSAASLRESSEEEEEWITNAMHTLVHSELVDENKNPPSPFEMTLPRRISQTEVTSHGADSSTEGAFFISDGVKVITADKPPYMSPVVFKPIPKLVATTGDNNMRLNMRVRSAGLNRRMRRSRGALETIAEGGNEVLEQPRSKTGSAFR